MPGRVLNDQQDMSKWVWNVELGNADKPTLKLGSVRGKPCAPSSSEVDHSGGLIEDSQAQDLLSHCGLLSRVTNQQKVLTDASLEAPFPTYYRNEVINRISSHPERHKVMYGHPSKVNERRYYAETVGNETEAVCRTDFELEYPWTGAAENVSGLEVLPLDQAAVCQYRVIPKPPDDR